MCADQLVYVETVLKCADLRSCTAAARTLGLTRAAVSQRIQALEQALKAPVFQRYSGHVRLSDAGQRLYAYAQPVLELLFFFQAEDGIRDDLVTGVQTCALPIFDAGRLGTEPPPPNGLAETPLTLT